MDVLYVNNDHVVEITRLRDAGGQLITGATVRAVLYENGSEVEVPGVAWPLSLVYDAGRQSYIGELSNAIGVVHNGRYQMKLSAEYAGKRYEVLRTVQAERRYS
jgi:hypothetical protein